MTTGWPLRLRRCQQRGRRRRYPPASVGAWVLEVAPGRFRTGTEAWLWPGWGPTRVRWGD